MWEMIDSDFDIDCGNECGPGPPPMFRIPPPPRPPFLQEVSKCSEDALNDYEMCEAIPILDASLYSSPSLQTSAMILLCSVLLLLFVFISSLLVWKHKRKVQNFLPCKTPTRDGPGMNGPGGLPVGHQVTYEDPDMHMNHHRPLVMRNIDMLHPKTIHYPSGFPMPRSPPLFICSSPGPDPYRSHDNVYEELEHRRDSDSEPAGQSDDDFAEDELSLPGDRSFNKSSPDGTTVATIYQERSVGNTSAPSENNNYLERNRIERNSLLSSASSSAETNNVNNVRPSIRNSSSSNDSTNNNNNNSSNSNKSNTGFFRFRTPAAPKTNNFSMDDLNSSAETNPCTDALPAGPLMALPSTYNSVCAENHKNSNYYSPHGETDVERRNRINAQLSNPSATPTVATIFRDRGIRYPTMSNPHYYPQHVAPLQMGNNNNNTLNNLNRSRTNPRVLDRRRVANGPESEANNNNPDYTFQEPVYQHEGVLYNGCLHGNSPRYILPDAFTTFRNYNNLNNPHQQYYRDPHSDSGYSNHTQASTRSLWPRRKSNQNTLSTTPSNRNEGS